MSINLRRAIVADGWPLLKGETPPLKELPIACDMTALSAAQRERQQILMRDFHGLIQKTEALDNGYAFRLKADMATILAAAEFITIERLCCPFLTFELSVGAANEPLWLRISGRAGVKQFIEAEFGVT